MYFHKSIDSTTPRSKIPLCTKRTLYNNSGVFRAIFMWQRSTLSRAGSAQGSRNAHFINRRQRETQQNDLIRLLQPFSYLTQITDITVRFETCHRRHRPHRSHRSHSSHITHKVSQKKAGFDQRNQSEMYSYTVSQYLTWNTHGRETRLVTNYNDWMTKIRNTVWEPSILAHVYI